VVEVSLVQSALVQAVLNASRRAWRCWQRSAGGYARMNVRVVRRPAAGRRTERFWRPEEKGRRMAVVVGRCVGGVGECQVLVLHIKVSHCCGVCRQRAPVGGASALSALRGAMMPVPMVRHD